MSAAIPHLDSVRCCDCLDGLRDLPDGCIDLVVTDPPYSYVTNRGGGCFGSDRRGYHMELEPISHGFVREVNEELLRVMRAPNIYIWCSRDQIRDTIDWWMDNADVGMDVLTWHKTNPVPTCNNKYLSDTEYLLFFRGKGVRVNGSYDTKRKFYVSGVNKADKDLYNHPTVKPYGMTRNLVVNSSAGGCSAGSLRRFRNDPRRGEGAGEALDRVRDRAVLCGDGRKEIGFHPHGTDEGAGMLGMTASGTPQPAHNGCAVHSLTLRGPSGPMGKQFGPTHDEPKGTEVKQ